MPLVADEHPAVVDAAAAAAAGEECPFLRHAAAAETEEEQQLLSRSVTDKSTTDKGLGSRGPREMPAVQGYQE